MELPLKTVVIDKKGNLKELTIKKFNTEDLYKKCGFKTDNNFKKMTEWYCKLDKCNYFISLYAKDKGKAGGENKYEFPPPVDKTLYFGNCVLICHTIENAEITYCDLNISLWNQIYEKLFGGFHDLTSTAIEDDNEIDELDNIPNENKTKSGYLKDGFVVDSDDMDNVSNESDDETSVTNDGTELSEDEYD